MEFHVGDTVDWLGWNGEVIEFVALKTDRPTPKLRVRFYHPEQEFFFLPDGRMNQKQTEPVLTLKHRPKRKSGPEEG